MNCPICNKTGLHDYTINPVVCPQCNADLKGFMLIKQTNSIFNKSVKKQKLLFSISALLLIIFIFFFFINVNTQKEKFQISVSKYDSLINTNKTLNSKLITEQNKFKQFKDSFSNPKEIDFLYIVKKGDNLSKIAYFFYNDWKMYKKIEQDNNLKNGDILLPKETLILILKIKSK